MDLIQLKIDKGGSTTNHIKIIRKFYSSLSVGSIKQRIEENNFVVGFDSDYYDVVEDIHGIDKKGIFRDMIAELSENGANISIYKNGELLSTEVLDNWLKTLNEIDRAMEIDVERELGEKIIIDV